MKKNEKKGEIEIFVPVWGEQVCGREWERHTPSTRDSRSSDLFLIIRFFHFWIDDGKGEIGKFQFSKLFSDKNPVVVSNFHLARLLAVGLMMLFEKFKTSGKTQSHISDPKAEQEAATGGSSQVGITASYKKAHI